MGHRDKEFPVLSFQRVKRRVALLLRWLQSILFVHRLKPTFDSSTEAQVAPLPNNETERLEILRSYDILDTLPEPAFDDLTALAAYICGTPIALVSLVDADRQWFKSKVGINAVQTARSWSFCAHAILQPEEILVVPDALKDDRFAANPLVTQDPWIRFYAGAPLVTQDGFSLGTLCVIDTVPRSLTVEQLDALRCLSRQATAQMELIREIRRRQEAEMQIKHLSMTDELTQLYNRRGFFLLAEQQLKLARRMRTLCWVVFIDLDGLKYINDMLGHGQGDELLINAAQILKRSFRDSDIVARLGGDEFAILMSGFSGNAIDIQLRLQADIDQFNQQYAKRCCPLSMSIGVECFDPNSDTSLEMALAKADELMYVCKHLKKRFWQC